ncbi:hypothetical protein A2576_02600 [Candidatus Amesbacteria bacterium RIFOXYD1_FULL_47_9]|uniref:AI-2E family transporter n=6 Tax=Candidatus Amesiibacteriota TaxID=1752730 RepID=A0A1F5A221_9BACT|nr:MAG: hypothetical protein A2V48_04570 [Candidatus Amesbacteria bacterium RBG_19FT_COMBO_48_16]OGD02924.1 MAG: hypothetical protein A2354_02400 [Candidatus Amesbacteria bacterium RIFOXYB1_FULL_47_12]OGD11814.1 MAG: hypothetical protein A2576_02600 [Candidatus Amesbacteria bacterium RIFOXYD1_FULL_47_9]
MPRKIEISHRTIVFIAIFIFLIWFIVQIKDILLMLFISIILMSALNPGVDRLERWGLPRSLAIAIAYIALWLVLGSVIAGIVPPLVEQTGRLVRLLPTAINRVEFFNAHQQQIGEQLLTRIGSLPENLLKLSLGVFSNFLNVLTTLVITFYLLLERQHLNKYLAILLAGESPARASRLVNEIERRLGSWVRGELILMLAVGVLTYFGLTLLGLDIALPLAILAGVLEIVPNIGPIVSAVPAVLIGLIIHPLLGLSTAALYLLVQFMENNFLVPKIMQRAVGVNPLVSILALMIGFRLAGPAGAILAIPTILVVQTIGVEFFSLRHLESLSS